MSLFMTVDLHSSQGGRIKNSHYVRDDCILRRRKKQHAVSESNSDKVVKRSVPEEVTLIKDLQEVKEGAEQRLKDRAGLVYSRNSKAILEQKSEKK